jgi:hypothetical protein
MEVTSDTYPVLISADSGQNTGWHTSIDGGAAVHIIDLEPGAVTFSGTITLQMRPLTKADGSNWADEDEGAIAVATYTAASNPAAATNLVSQRYWGKMQFRLICAVGSYTAGQAHAFLGIRNARQMPGEQC